MLLPIPREFNFVETEVIADVCYSFGTIATLLEMIPFANMLFAFTNTTGAALWAADIEAKGTDMTKSTAPGLREAAKKAE